MPCDKCEGKEEVYCNDCEVVFCSACAVRVHHPNTKDELHSLETIDEDADRGVHLLTPLSEEILVLVIIIFVLQLPWYIPQDYPITATVCPALKHVQHYVATTDAGLFYLAKGTLLQYCSIEDSLWRFFGDFWVRGIVTDTDTMFILVSTAGMLILSEVALLVFIIPFIAFVYAVIYTIVYWLESFLPRWDWLVEVENFLQVFDLFNFFDVPPDTKLRKRKDFDPFEGLYYRVTRKIRRPLIFYNSTNEYLGDISKKACIFCLVARLLCIMLHTGPLLAKMLRLIGYRRLIKRHRMWFEPYMSKEENSDALLWEILSRGREIPFGWLFHYPIIILVPLAILGVYIWYVRREARKKFDADWDERGRMKCLGDCDMQNCPAYASGTKKTD